MPASRVERVGVFCGARPGARPQHLRLATEFGEALAQRGTGLVYGAGGVGIMGAVADAVLDAGAPVTGVIPRQLYEREQPDESRTEVIVVETMHERKALMYRLAVGFAVLPGGLGTLDELLEVATWNQLGIHHKPLVLVNQGGFFDPLLTLLDNMVADGFISQEERVVIQVASGVEEALDCLVSPEPKPKSKPERPTPPPVAASRAAAAPTAAT
ncbi:TIGR00730 family Rossman fold protein [Streptomyces sp. 35G-GA-8]|uniref:LOG family protein n=1 Tax=Streptomyces sp. 35G-GA-8 TaxID=2939434 RepID=UPI00201F6FFF|nr:TIGR00730 family Rossman fold protein [Streptomyces sp. 35G-GA-8]MCL7376593.1 TIGR00730 family Rossman fold protein [Streptomyces sp. 35G-GA-8]